MRKKRLDIIFFMSGYKDKDEVMKNPSYSGGSNILKNLLYRWQNLLDIEVFTWDGGEYFLKFIFGIDKAKYHNVLKLRKKRRYSFSLFVRVLKSAWWALKSKKRNIEFMYSA